MSSDTVVKWSMFWTIICASFAFIAGSYAFTWAGGLKLTDAVVYNDRVRASEDKDLAVILQAKVDVINKEVAEKLDRIILQTSGINVAMASVQKQVEVNTKRLEKLDSK